MYYLTLKLQRIDRCQVIQNYEQIHFSDTDISLQIGISQISAYFTNPGDCRLNRIEIYDGSSLPIDLRVENCGHGPLEHFQSKSNKVFVRIFSNALNTKPTLTLLFTKFIVSK